MPPAADKESVQPGNGSLRLEAMIAGLTRQTERWPLLFLRDFSARFFVKV